MSTTSHTPGPWQANFESFSAEWAIITNAGGSIVANVNADYRQQANARLISAAPDMHHALYLALGCLKCHMFDCQREGLAAAAVSAERAVNATLAAIAKAEGVK